MSVFLIGFVLSCLTASISAQNMFRKVNDFDGDGKADFAVTRNVNDYKYWYVWGSTSGFGVIQWGLATDKNAAGDYDGDGRTDFAVLRATGGLQTTGLSFYAYQSATSSFFQRDSVYPGIVAGVVPAQQDYDGDGKTDAAAYFTNGFGGQIRVNESSTNGNIIFNLPATDFNARLGDMTGDGKSDFVSVSASTFAVTITDYVSRSTRSVNFGASGDRYLAADFDADGKGDLTIYRPADGSWWWLRSSDNVVNSARWGLTGDIPIPADYDGDGKTDLAIWRGGSPSTYWVYGSQVGGYAFPFGIETDTPVSY